MRIVTTNELANYKVLPFDLYAENRKKILDAGEILTPGKIIMLKNHPKIYTEEIGKDDIEEQTENKNVNSKMLEFSYENLDPADFETVLNKDSCVKMDSQVKIKYFYKRILDLMKNGFYDESLIKLSSLVNILRSEVYKQLQKTEKGSHIRFLGEYEICHPLNVAIISGLIAQKLEYSSPMVDQVMLAALLHDVGKLKINLIGTNPLVTMNEDEVKEHTILGYKLIKEKFDLPDSIAKVALEHHENNDGSGYPKGLSNDYISEFSQIVNVANYYDNLAFNRTHTLVENNKDALHTMLELGSKKFSARMLYSFIHMFQYDDSKGFEDMIV